MCKGLRAKWLVGAMGAGPPLCLPIAILTTFTALLLQGCDLDGTCPNSQLRLALQMRGVPNVCGLETFMMNGTQYLATASCSQSEPSPIYSWDGASLNETQRFDTVDARDVRYFEIGAVPYLAFSKFEQSANATSPIYRWNGVEFAEFQNLPTYLPSALEDFVIDGVTYLAVAHQDALVSVYIFNGSAFADYQDISTNSDPRALAYFEVEGEKCLAVACHEGWGVAIYRWAGASFGLWTTLEASWAVDLAAFHVNGGFYLAVAEHDAFGSRIYTKSGADFQVLQTLAGPYTNGVHAFVAGGVQHLALARSHEDPNTVYAWDGSGFQPKFCAPGGKAHDWTSLATAGSSHLLLSRSGSRGLSEIFEIPDL